MTPRILFLITDLDLGGSPLMLRALARGLHLRGNTSPLVVSLKPPGIVGDLLRAEGVELHTLNMHHPLDLLPGLYRFTRLLRQVRPAVVVSMLVHANLLATLARPLCPKTVWLQSLHTLQERPRWHWTVSRLLARRAAALVAPSPEILEKIGDFSGNLRNLRGIVVPNGINVARFACSEAIPDPLRPWPKGAPVVGYVGRFDPVKRLDVLLEAAGLIIKAGTDLHVALIGYGPQDPALRAQADRLGLHGKVHFLGPTTEPERWYKSLPIFCLPSLAEGFGLSLVEALAAGCRVVAADTPVLRTLAANDATLVTDPSARALALALQEVIAQGPLPPDTQAPRLARLQHDYSEEAMVEKWEKIVNFFAASNPLPPP